MACIPVLGLSNFQSARTGTEEHVHPGCVEVSLCVRASPSARSRIASAFRPPATSRRRSSARQAVVFSATGTVTGTENLANAAFYLDGELQKPGTWIALYSAGRCTVKAQSGTMLILK